MFGRGGADICGHHQRTSDGYASSGGVRPRDATPAVPRRDFRVERTLHAVTPAAAFLEPAVEPVPDGLGDDVSSVAPRRATELSEHLRRLRRGHQQIRRITG